MSTPHTSGNLANLVATIDSVATGNSIDEEVGDGNGNNVIHEEFIEETVGVLEGSILRLANGQTINVVHMTESLEDGINVVHVETTELGEHEVTTVGEFCEVDITDDQAHILHEPASHVVVNTEREVLNELGSERPSKKSASEQTKINSVLPEVPFSFPGQTFDIKCQKLILNVWDFFKRIKKNPDLLDEIRTPQERAAAALHISAATIGKIGKNFKKTGKLEAPNRRRNRSKPVVDSVTPEQEQIIRNVIKEFKENKMTLTLPTILNECRRRINFVGGTTSFRRILQRMGYRGMANISGPNSSSHNNAQRTQKGNSFLSSLNNKDKLSDLAHQSISPVKNHRPTKQTSNPISEIIIRSEPEDYIPVSTSMTSRKPLNAHSSSPQKRRRSSPSPVSMSKQEASKLMTNLLGNNVFQLKGESLVLSQETAAAIASANGGADGPQTIHVLQSDNTIQQIQIVYADV